MCACTPTCTHEPHATQQEVLRDLALISRQTSDLVTFSRSSASFACIHHRSRRLGKTHILVFHFVTFEFDCECVNFTRQPFLRLRESLLIAHLLRFSLPVLLLLYKKLSLLRTGLALRTPKKKLIMTVDTRSTCFDYHCCSLPSSPSPSTSSSFGSFARCYVLFRFFLLYVIRHLFLCFKLHSKCQFEFSHQSKRLPFPFSRYFRFLSLSLSLSLSLASNSISVLYRVIIRALFQLLDPHLIINLLFLVFTHNFCRISSSSSSSSSLAFCTLFVCRFSDFSHAPSLP
jgi:hypothetical protein